MYRPITAFRRPRLSRFMSTSPLGVASLINLKKGVFVADQAKLFTDVQIASLNAEVLRIQKSTIGTIQLATIDDHPVDELETFTTQLHNATFHTDELDHRGITMAYFREQRSFQIRMGAVASRYLTKEVAQKIQRTEMIAHFANHHPYEGLMAGVKAIGDVLPNSIESEWWKHFKGWNRVVLGRGRSTGINGLYGAGIGVGLYTLWRAFWLGVTAYALYRLGKWFLQTEIGEEAIDVLGLHKADSAKRIDDKDFKRRWIAEYEEMKRNESRRHNYEMPATVQKPDTSHYYKRSDTVQTPDTGYYYNSTNDHIRAAAAAAAATTASTSAPPPPKSSSNVSGTMKAAAAGAGAGVLYSDFEKYRAEQRSMTTDSAVNSGMTWSSSSPVISPPPPSSGQSSGSKW